MPWRREWQPTPVFLPGEFHGQRSLADYSPWDLKELDMTERLIQQHPWIWIDLRHLLKSPQRLTGLEGETCLCVASQVQGEFVGAIRIGFPWASLVAQW